jgi:hypothetical protein
MATRMVSRKTTAMILRRPAPRYCALATCGTAGREYGEVSCR